MDVIYMYNGCNLVSQSNGLSMLYDINKPLFFHENL